MIKKNIMTAVHAVLSNRKIKKLFLFGIVGGTGVVINTAILFGLTYFMDFHYLLAAAIATEAAIISNFFGNHIFTFRHEHKGSTLREKFLFFQSFSLLTLVGTLSILFLLTTFFGQTYLLLWNLVAILLMFLMNFALNQKFTWKNTAPKFSRSGKKRKMFLFLVVFLAVITLLPVTQAASPVATQIELQVTNITSSEAPNGNSNDAKNETDDDNEDSEDVENEDLEDTTNTTFVPNGESENETIPNNNSTTNETNETNTTPQQTNNNTNNSTTNETNDDTEETTNVTFTINTEPAEVTISLNGSVIGITTNTTLSTNQTPGNYLLSASKEEYETWEENITLTETTTKDITLQLSGNSTNSTDETTTVKFTINTEPAEVTIALNNTVLGTTTNSTFSTNTTTGNYLLKASKTGYGTWEETIILTETTIKNITLQQTNNNTNNNTNETTNNSIIASGTDVPLTTDPNSSATHHLFEIDTGNFWITQQSAGETTWLVNGVIKATTTQKDSSFNWTPGILSVPITPPDYPNIELFTVTAKTANGNATWTVDVENVINPFFEGAFGSSNADIHVFTNNFASNYSEVSVVVDNSGKRTSYSLNPVITEDETDWRTSVTGLQGGNNWLREITTIDWNNNSETYTFGNVRAHYTTPEDNDRDRGSRGGGGGGSFSLEEDLELVYVRFSKDVLKISDPQMIMLDAKTTNSEVQRVEAIIQTPRGTPLEIELSLIEGDSGYGTWSEAFSGFTPGEYNLEEIHLWGREEDANIIPVNGSSFYVLSPEQSTSSPLQIVYSTLTPSSIETGMNATLRLDASDPDGITKVTATVITTKNDTFTVELDQVSGTSQYGTWEGVIEAKFPDTTYTISEITVSNALTSKSYEIKDRSFYVAASAQNENRNSITGALVSDVSAFSRQAIEQLLRKPMIPMIVGFSIMLLILGALFLSHRVKKQMQRDFEK